MSSTDQLTHPSTGRSVGWKDFDHTSLEARSFCVSSLLASSKRCLSLGYAGRRLAAHVARARVGLLPSPTPRRAPSQRPRGQESTVGACLWDWEKTQACPAEAGAGPAHPPQGSNPPLPGRRCPAQKPRVGSLAATAFNCPQDRGSEFAESKT